MAVTKLHCLLCVSAPNYPSFFRVSEILSMMLVFDLIRHWDTNLTAKRSLKMYTCAHFYLFLSLFILTFASTLLCNTQIS